MDLESGSQTSFTSRSIEAILGFYSRITPTGRGTYRLVRFARELLPASRRRGEFQTPDGVLMNLDLSIYPDCSMAFGFFELDTARLLRKLLRPGDHFVDGGANIGYFTLMAARIIGPTGRIDAFEPQPQNRARLVAHLDKNGLGDRVRVHPVALSDSAGEMMIHSYSDADHNHGCSSLFPETGVATIAHPVATVRMDEAIAGTKPRLIKMDLQGAEPLAVTGMTRLLRADEPPMIVTEYSPSCAQTAGFKPRELVDRILTLQPSYRVFNIGRQLKQIDPTDDVLHSLMGSGGEVNLLFDANRPG